MTDRILLSQDRLLITKPGVDASGNPADDDKVFDSDWHFGGAIIETGNQEFLRDLNGGSSPYVINFKNPLTYVPMVQVYSCVPPWGVENSVSGATYNRFIQGPPVFFEYYPVDDPNGRVRDFVTVTNTGISIPHIRPTSGHRQINGPDWFWKNPGLTVWYMFHYIVFAL